MRLVMVVFDLDDTLYKERDFVASGHRAVAEYIGKYRPGFDISGSWDDELLTVYRNHIPDLMIDKDVMSALLTLKEHNIKIGIVTDGRSISQRNKIQSLNLDRLVEAQDIIISDELGFDKTTPVPFERIMELNPTEDSFVYIADNPIKDFYQPNMLGWTTIMLIDKTGMNVHPQLMPDDERFRPSEIIESILDYINNYCNAKNRK